MIDLGDNPQGTPPTAEQKTQIKSVLEVGTAEVTTAAILSAFAAEPPSNAQKQALAEALGYDVYATVELANAGIGVIGRVFFNSTTYEYDSTTATS